VLADNAHWRSMTRSIGFSAHKRVALHRIGFFEHEVGVLTIYDLKFGVLDNHTRLETNILDQNSVAFCFPSPFLNAPF
jgi:hypothetical protein